MATNRMFINTNDIKKILSQKNSREYVGWVDIMGTKSILERKQAAPTMSVYTYHH